MPATLHIVRDNEPSTDPALRPISFDTYIGQTEVVSILRDAVSAAKRGGWQLDHVLLTGSPGLGKTSAAAVIAAELGVKLIATSAPAIEHKGQLASLLTSLGEGDVLFIDEIHALDHSIAEVLYTALEDRVIDLPAGKRVIRVPLQRFTLVAATTHAGKLPKPLRDRFGLVCQLRLYTEVELTTIVTAAAHKLGVSIDAEGAAAIAKASRGTPRIAHRLLRRVRDAATNLGARGVLVVRGQHAAISGPVAVAALARLGIDQLGLEPLDRRYLAVVAERPVGVEAISSALGEDKSSVEALESYLVTVGLVARTRGGRVATEAGREHLKVVQP